MSIQDKGGRCAWAEDTSYESSSFGDTAGVSGSGSGSTSDSGSASKTNGHAAVGSSSYASGSGSGSGPTDPSRSGTISSMSTAVPPSSTHHQSTYHLSTLLHLHLQHLNHISYSLRGFQNQPRSN
ncbi:hypothetical protein D9758_018149 [Tetrapyrgos nigripes]|uniref:Uncharacterized protein n=1 Tax=Tetrapyrgos nigripes TaxID=182062 RepID=A0A8H5F1T9_9AGAR|nr:hypothetical protein D9758_018149 [Tetrapyrgos nigripes]